MCRLAFGFSGPPCFGRIGYMIQGKLQQDACGSRVSWPCGGIVIVRFMCFLLPMDFLSPPLGFCSQRTQSQKLNSTVTLATLTSTQARFRQRRGQRAQWLKNNVPFSQCDHLNNLKSNELWIWMSGSDFWRKNWEGRAFLVWQLKDVKSGSLRTAVQRCSTSILFVSALTGATKP